MQKSLEEKLKSLPEGRLKIRHYKERLYFTVVNRENKEKVLHKDDEEIIQNIAQKEYYEEVLKAAKCEVALWDKIMKLHPAVLAEDVYDQISEERKPFVTPIIPTDEEFVRRWQEKAYTPKGLSEDTPYFTTMRGERVRSKSEMIIADRLFVNGIPYKYECPHQ